MATMMKKCVRQTPLTCNLLSAATITNSDGTDRDGSLHDEGENPRRTEQGLWCHFFM